METTIWCWFLEYKEHDALAGAANSCYHQSCAMPILDWHCWVQAKMPMPDLLFPAFWHWLITADVSWFSSLLVCSAIRTFTRRTSLGAKPLYKLFYTLFISYWKISFLLNVKRRYKWFSEYRDWQRLPYSKPAHNQLSYTAPIWATLHSTQ